MLDKTVAKQMSHTRQKVLENLKRKGPMTTDQLSEVLGITSMGVRGHLVALERDNLITYDTQQHGMGRPRYVYTLTKRGDALFPRRYAQLANSLLETLGQTLGDTALEQVFAQRNATLQAQYEPHLVGLTLVEKVRALAKLRTQEGYMCDCERSEEGTLYLHERNCSICEVAHCHQDACEAELTLFKAVLPEARVVRQSHIMRGDAVCSYEITDQGGESGDA